MSAYIPKYIGTLDLQNLTAYRFTLFATPPKSLKPTMNTAKLTRWFNAKSQSPSREGWYDCKECNARHYFKDGLWYRSKKSIRNGAMTVHKMHWRGLVREPLKSLLERYDSSTPRSQEELAWENVPPVGREFGSSDFDKLMEEDQKTCNEKEASRALKAAGVLTESGKLSDEYSTPQFISKRDAQ